MDKRGTRKALEERDYSNRKPYRPKLLKMLAKKKAKKQDDGAFRCHSVGVMYHG